MESGAHGSVGPLSSCPTQGALAQSTHAATARSLRPRGQRSEPHPPASSSRPRGPPASHQVPERHAKKGVPGSGQGGFTQMGWGQGGGDAEPTVGGSKRASLDGRGQGGPSRCRQGRSAQRLLSQGPLIYVFYLVTYTISLNFLNWCGLQPSDPIPGGRVLRADLPPRRRQELPAARPPVCARSLPSPRGKEGARHAAPHAQPPLSPRAPAHVKGLGDSESARAR